MFCDFIGIVEHNNCFIVGKIQLPKKTIMKNQSTIKLMLLGAGLILITTGSAQRNERSANNGRNDRIIRYQRPQQRNNYYTAPRTSITIGRSNYPRSYYGKNYYTANYGRYYPHSALNIGFRFNMLPTGYWPMQYRGNSIYYYNGAFMRPYNNYYEIVDAPIGAEVPNIPSDARIMQIDGRNYYESNGCFFQKIIHPDGEVWYRVMGKNGRLETDF